MSLCAGICLRDPDRLRSLEIDKALSKERNQLSRQLRLLLLGAGESGKSTVVKQMQLIHGAGFTDDQRQVFVLDFCRNVIVNLVELAGDLTDNASDRDKSLEALRPLLKEPQRLIDPALALWADAGVQAACARANEFQLGDSFSYFMERLPALSSDDFTMNDQDIVRVRNQTSGIWETSFVLDRYTFRIVDVGGQRQERHKWIQCFSDVTAIIWVVSMSAFDQTLREDSKTNRLRESITLFENIWRNRWLRTVSTILFLNKKDLLQEKMEREGSGAHFQAYFPDYNGSSTYDDARAFILKQFESIARHSLRAGPSGEKILKSLYAHTTCAIDTRNVERVFEDCRHMIIEENLARLSLL